MCAAGGCDGGEVLFDVFDGHVEELAEDHRVRQFDGQCFVDGGSVQLDLIRTARVAYAAEIDESPLLYDGGIEPEQGIGHVPIRSIIMPGNAVGMHKGRDVGEVVVVIDDVGQIRRGLVRFVGLGSQTRGRFDAFGKIDHVDGALPIRQLPSDPLRTAGRCLSHYDGLSEMRV